MTTKNGKVLPSAPAGGFLGSNNKPVVFSLDGNPVLSLENSAMPEKGVEVSSSLRLNKTYYPGNNLASLQIMGTEDSDIELSGILLDSWEREGFAASMRTQLNNLYRFQERLQMVWGDTIDVEGVIKSLSFEHHTDGHVAYTLTFCVQSTAETAVVYLEDAVEADITKSRLQRLLEQARLKSRFVENVAAAANVVRGIF